MAVIPAAAFVLVAVLTLGPAVRWDQAVSLWVQGPEEAPLTLIGSVTEWLFSGPVVLGAAALLFLVLAMRRRWLVALSAGLIFPLVVTEALLKLSIDQPSATHYLLVRSAFHRAVPSPEPLLRGFPSGHGARIGFVVGWLAVLLLPARYRLAAGIAAVVVGLFVAWTRIYVGDHSVLEMLAGLLLSLIFLLPAWALARAAKQTPAR